MTLEELELEPSSKFIGAIEEPSPLLAKPLIIGVGVDGLWQCKECKVWVGGKPSKFCKWCEDYHENLIDMGLNPHGSVSEQTKNQVMEEEGYLPKYIFKRLNASGKVVHCFISEDGRAVDLDDY